MTDQQEQLYAQAEEIAAYNALALRSCASLAHIFQADKEAMRIFSFVWGRNARHMAKAVDLFDLNTEPATAYSPDEYLSMFAIASLKKHEAAQVAKDWKDNTLPYWKVRERVDELKPERKSKTPKAKEKREVQCPRCDHVWEETI